MAVSLDNLITIMSTEWLDHGQRVRHLSRKLGHTMRLETEEIRRLEIASLLHDIGKTHIHDEILSKPTSLSPEEWTVIEMHPQMGFDIVDGLVHPEIADAILAHHERFDGTGYPHKRAGNDIPLIARILSVADAFDAIVSDRCYQPALPQDWALTELRLHAGTQFDPTVVGALDDLLERDVLAAVTMGSAVAVG